MRFTKKQVQQEVDKAVEALEASNRGLKLQLKLAKGEWGDGFFYGCAVAVIVVAVVRIMVECVN